MIANLLQTFHHLPVLGVYLFVFVWLAAESCGVPLPNELVLLLTGSLAAGSVGIHALSPVWLVAVATVGSLLGASLAYMIGYSGGRAAVSRLGKPLRLDEARLASVERWFDRTGAFAIFVSRITPFVRTVASFPAGMLRFPQAKFVIATVAGSLIWCTVLVTLGDTLGSNFTIALKLIQQYTVPAIIVLGALVAGYFWLHSRLAQTAHAATSGEDSGQ